MSININEDKEYEEYWLYLKDIISRNVHGQFYSYMLDYSNDLNNLKKICAYTDIVSKITSFLNDNTCKIICMFFQKMNYYDIHLLHVHLRRWLNYSKPLSYRLDGLLEYDLLKTITTYIQKKHGYYVINPTLQNYFINCLNIGKYDIGCLTFNEYNKLSKCHNDIVIESIKNGEIAIIDIMTKYVDITVYFPEGTDKKYNTSKGQKLYKILSNYPFLGKYSKAL